MLHALARGSVRSSVAVCDSVSMVLWFHGAQALHWQIMLHNVQWSICLYSTERLLSFTKS